MRTQYHPVGYSVALTLLLGIAADCKSPSSELEATARPLQAVLTSPAPSGAAGEKFGAISIVFPNRTTADVAEWARRLVGVMTGKAVAILDATADTASNRVFVAIADKPNIRVVHERETDAIEALNLDVAGNHDQTIPDLTTESARQLFASTYASLVQVGMIDPGHISAGDVEESLRREAFARSDQVPTTRVLAHHFFVPLKVGGVAVHDAEHRELGLTVVVHRSGDLHTLRIRGLALAGSQQGAFATAGQVARGRSKADIDALVKAQFPDSDITSVGVRHIAPRGVGAHPASLREVYYEVPRMAINGRTIHGRVVWVSFPLDDAKAAPEMWPVFDPANPRNVGDSK